MKKPLIAAGASFLIIVAALVWWFSDGQVIKRNTRALAETLTLTSEDAKSTRALKGQDFAALLALDFTGSLDIDNYEGDISREEAVTGHQYLSLRGESSHVTVTDIEVTVNDHESATVTAKFGILVKIKDGSSYSDSADATLEWVKTDGNIWKLRSTNLRK